MQKFLRASLVIAGLGSLILVGVCWWMSSLLTRPQQSTVAMPQNLVLESVNLKTIDNIKIAGSFLPPRDKAKTCFCFTAMAGTALNSYPNWQC
jgi:hypothetical protein